VSVCANLSYVLTANALYNIVWGSTKELGNNGELIDMVFPREERLALEHLGKDAACAPDVHLDVVFLPCEHDFGGSVVSGGDVPRHLGVLYAGETKVADFKVTVFVDENIAGL